MIESISPQFFTSNLSQTLSYYRDVLEFQTTFIYGDPPSYAGVQRDGCSFMFRHVDESVPQIDNKLIEEYLDAYVRLTDIDALYTEFQERGAVFIRSLELTPWGVKEFVIADCDGRLICFGQTSK